MKGYWALWHPVVQVFEVLAVAQGRPKQMHVNRTAPMRAIFID